MLALRTRFMARMRHISGGRRAGGLLFYWGVKLHDQMEGENAWLCNGRLKSTE
jgi:hypothetical protein